MYYRSTAIWIVCRICERFYGTRNTGLVHRESSHFVCKECVQEIKDAVRKGTEDEQTPKIQSEA